MKLAIAFGARGKGKALAHYEPARVVINLTKLKGAGSLAHEWGHAFDDFLGLRCGTKGVMTFLSNAPLARLSKEFKVADAMSKVVNAMMFTEKTNEEILLQYNKEIDKYNKSLKELIDNRWLRELKDGAYSNAASPEEYSQAEQLLNEVISTSSEESLQNLRLLYKSVKGRLPSKDTRDYADTCIRHINSIRRELSEYKDTGEFSGVRTKSSNFYKSARELDKNRKEAYYSDRCEMFARSFESYIEDKLTEKGLKSQYLVHSTRSNALYGDLQPYPEGEERLRINEAIENLVRVAYQEYRSEFGKSNYSMYNNKDNIVSYRKSIKTIRKDTNTEIETEEQSKELSPRIPIQKKEDILESLRDRLMSIAGNRTERGKRVDYSNYMNRLAVIGKMKLGYAGIGFNDLKKSKLKGMSNSKSYVDTVLEAKGRVIYIDSGQKPEKQLEGLIEALTRMVVSSKYGQTNASAMIGEGVTYIICKNIGLDVRTYCLSEQFEALSKDSKQSQIYLKLCKQMYDNMSYLITT